MYSYFTVYQFWFLNISILVGTTCGKKIISSSLDKPVNKLSHLLYYFKATLPICNPLHLLSKVHLLIESINKIFYPLLVKDILLNTPQFFLCINCGTKYRLR